MKETKTIFILSLILGWALPTALLLYDDWCHVKKTACPIIDRMNDDIFLWLMLAFAAIAFYFWLYKIFRWIIPSLVVTIMLLILLAFIDLLLLWEFHFWIGGNK